MPAFLSEPQRWIIPAILIVSVLGTALMVWWERRRPSAYSRRLDVLAGWRTMSTAEQEAADEASLDLAAQADLDAREAAQESARVAVDRATQINFLSRF